MKRKEKPKRSLPIRIIRGALLVVVLVAAVVLVMRVLEYKQSADVYGQLALEMTPSNVQEEQSDSSSQADKEEELPLLEVDFERLQKENPEVVAWLEFPPLGLSYPVLHTDNNQYYLNHLWNGQQNSSGSIFLDANNKSIHDLYTVVYGHNMHDGSMFGLFNRYLDRAYYEENGAYFRLYTPEGVWRYDVFTVAEVSENDSLYTVGYAKGQLYDKFLNRLAGLTLYQTETQVQPGDTVMTLSTCTANDSIRRILCARRGKQLD